MHVYYNVFCCHGNRRNICGVFFVNGFDLTSLYSHTDLVMHWVFVIYKVYVSAEIE